MIINGKSLLDCNPIRDMLSRTEVSHGTTYGLSEIGYDIRCKEDIIFNTPHTMFSQPNKFKLASSIEYFHMPRNLCARVCDKSTWARKGISVFNTLIKPGWNGYLTLELVSNSNQPLVIPAGSGIAQIVFEEISDEATYEGIYQNQESGAQPARAYINENVPESEPTCVAIVDDEILETYIN